MASAATNAEDLQRAAVGQQLQAAQNSLTPLARPVRESYVPQNTAASFEDAFAFNERSDLPEPPTVIAEFLTIVIDHCSQRATHFMAQDVGKSLAPLYNKVAEIARNAQAALVGKDAKTTAAAIESAISAFIERLDARSVTLLPKYNQDTNEILKVTEDLAHDLWTDAQLLTEEVEQNVEALKRQIPVSRKKMTDKRADLTEIGVRHAALEKRLPLQSDLEPMLTDARACRADSQAVEVKRQAALAAQKSHQVLYSETKSGLTKKRDGAIAAEKTAEASIAADTAQILKLLANIAKQKEVSATSICTADQAIKDLASLEGSNARYEAAHAAYVLRLAVRTTGNSAYQTVSQNLTDFSKTFTTDVNVYDTAWKKDRTNMVEQVCGVICAHDQQLHSLYSFCVTSHEALSARLSAEATTAERDAKTAHREGRAADVTRFSKKSTEKKVEAAEARAEYERRAAVLEEINESWKVSRAELDRACVENGTPLVAPPAAATASQDKESCEAPPPYAEEVQPTIIRVGPLVQRLEPPTSVWQRVKNYSKSLLLGPGEK